MNKYQEALKRLEGMVLTSPFKDDVGDGVVDMNNLYKCGTQLQNEFLHDLNVLKELVDKADSFEWIPFTFDEEGILNCELPDIDEDILVWDMSGMFDKENVWVDTWESPDFCVYELESGMDLEGLAWMPFPQPNKEQLGYEN
jgi:hypothetical protein|nr:MAG TPA: Protein of unknown function (DUF551) [Caudoviricetes sp.]